MPRLVENRPIGCNACHYGPVYGRESNTPTSEGSLLEVRWVCPRCGALIRVDEELIKNETGK